MRATRVPRIFEGMGTPVWKEVLCLGRHFDPKTGEWHEFKPANINRAHKNYQKMRARSVPVPACWEHQKNIEAGNAPATAKAIAEWKRNYARYTFAHILDSRINERGNLDMLHDVVDPEDVKQLEKVKFCSPKVYNAGYWDTKGGEYDGTTIAHVAATPTPVQFWQKPWELSEEDTFYLSYDPPEDVAVLEPETESCPRQDWSFDGWMRALDDALELSATEQPEEPPVADEPKTEEKPKGDKPKGDGMAEDLKALIDALKAKGMSISDKVTNLHELTIAVESSGGGEPEVPAEVEPEPEMGAGTEAAPGGPPMLMSTLDKNPDRKRKAQAWAKAEIADAKARIADAAKAGRDPKLARKLTRQVEGFEGVEMSFTDGEPKSPKWVDLDAAIKKYEESKPTFKLKADGSVDLSSTTAPVAAPRQGGMTEERAQVGHDVILGRKSVKDA